MGSILLENQSKLARLQVDIKTNGKVSDKESLQVDSIGGYAYIY